jgi:hypothetical protein
MMTAASLVLDDPTVSVTLDQSSGTATVTLRNTSSVSITPRASDTKSSSDPSAIAVTQGTEPCRVAVAGVPIPPQNVRAISVAFTGCAPDEAATLSVGLADHPIAFQSADHIEGFAIWMPLLIGLIALAITVGAGITSCLVGPDRLKAVLRNPPAIFSLSDGWLTNITGLSAAVVAIFSATGIADAILRHSDQLAVTLVGLFAAALLGAAPVVLVMMTSPEPPAEDGSVGTQTGVPAYVFAAGFTIAAAFTQLSAFALATDHGNLSTPVKLCAWGLLTVLAIVTALYARHYITSTLSLAEPAAPAGAAPQKTTKGKVAPRADKGKEVAPPAAGAYDAEPATSRAARRVNAVPWSLSL